ncbi:GNAT family N-acetyltransferase [uncultured Deefgea sp.]|uniref:GNAT family N-acetyltransferase n=1 Tax=uncultured Deefgea sp. TaxID=1304914 RepID=UPI002637BD17|nr:GNAT family protein [uncultured Deefgea sp.]
MNIRRLNSADAMAYQALRLAGLQESPSAFGSSYAEEKDRAITCIEEQLAAKTDRGLFGAFNGDDLIAVVALGRENVQKLSHKGIIYTMYVQPEYRNKGIARALLFESLTLARSVPQLMQLNLCVNSMNTKAIRLYESLGFKAFGHEINALFVDGEMHDEIHMSLCLHEK